jgi:hypothetical protein
MKKLIILVALVAQSALGMDLYCDNIVVGQATEIFADGSVSLASGVITWGADGSITYSNDINGWSVDTAANFIISGSVTSAGFFGPGAGITGIYATNIVGDGLKIGNVTISNGTITAHNQILAAGIATLTNGFKLVSTTAAQPTNVISLTYSADNGTLTTIGYTGVVAGTSFTIVSGLPADTNRVSWMILKP